MSSYSLTRVSDPDLVRGLTSAVAQDRSATVVVLAHLAEFDARRLYVPAAFPSTYLYCLHELHLSEDAAYKRIQGGACGTAVPGHLRGRGRRSPPPHRGEPAGSPPDARERRRALGRGSP